jgi:cytochrome c peroxidase
MHIMKILWSLIVSLLCQPATTPPPDPYRSPIDLAVVPGGRFALTANHTSDSVSLVDLEQGRVVVEARCGRKPAAVACSRDGKRFAVSELWSGTVSFFEMQATTLKPVGHARVGPFPRGLAFAADGGTLYVAVAGNDEVVQLDCDSKRITHRWPAPREPRQVILSEDGRWLAAASSRSGDVRCWDIANRQLLWERKIEDGFNLRGLAFTPDGQAIVCAHSVRREFPVSKANIAEGWVIDSRLSRFSIRADRMPPLGQLALDVKGQAVGDPYGAAFSADGHWLAVTGSGTHELLLLDNGAIPWSSGDPGDVLDSRLASAGMFRRLSLGGRPLALAFLGTAEQAAVVNYLSDAVQIVDVRAGKLLRTICLGAPADWTMARKGEALYYDAGRSHHQWFSCNTCHVDGHTCGLNFDTLNDDSYGNPKLTPSLRNASRTGPWTWHGWQKDLGAAVTKSLTQTMFGPEPTPDETAALLTFLETLDHPPNPNLRPNGEMSARAAQGRTLFHGKARCARCHHGDDYTSESNYDVQIEPDGSPYRLWNPPSLRGLFDRGPFLHDGRAKTLDDVLQKFHGPEKLGAQPLTAEERQALIEFLKSL